MEDVYNHNGKPCRKTEMKIGDTLFSVISVQSDSARETAYDKVKKLIMNETNSVPRVCAILTGKI